MIELRVFLPGNSLVRELDLRGSKMGGFKEAKLYILRLWPVQPMILAVLKLRVMLPMAAHSLKRCRAHGT